MNANVLTLFLLPPLLLLSTAAGQEDELLVDKQEGLSVDRQHVAQVIESHLAALEGWRKGDFLLRISESGDGRYFKLEEQDLAGFEVKYVNGPEAMSTVTRIDILARVIFDLDQEKALIINRGENEERIFNGLDEEI